MASVLRRTLIKAKYNVITNGQGYPLSDCLLNKINRQYSDDKSTEYTSGTILYETGLEVQELPVIIRKVKDIDSFYSDKAKDIKQDHEESPNDSAASVNYDMIRAEFKECLALRDVFTLLSKCIKITPNIALGAMERIYDLEKNPHPLDMDPHNANINMAKGAIIDKLLSVVMKTEDTATILNTLNSSSSFVVPYKHQLTEELLLRALDNKLSVEQLCEFVTFLGNHKDIKCSDMIDKLWVAFIAKENDISSENIVQLFHIVPFLKESRKPVLNVLEQKFMQIWSNIKFPAMQEILNAFIKEKYMPVQNYEVCGRWFHTNIHNLDEDNLLEIITKFSKLKYIDLEIEKALQKYVKAKGSKISSQVLVVGILNYCMQFQIRNPMILDGCAEYFINHGDSVPYSFLKSIIYPYGYLSFDPLKSKEFWDQVESVVYHHFENLKSEDLSFIFLSFIYNGKYPLDLVHRFFKNNHQLKSNDVLKKNMYLIDTAFSLECCDYLGPLLPKDHWSKKSIPQDARVRNVIEKLYDDLTSIAGGSDKLSTPVFIPHLHADETYLIDVMLHPVGLGNSTTNWKSKIAKNENIGLLIHLPEHYCADDVTLIGPQVMRMKHIRLMGIQVVSLRYSQICRYLTSDKDGLNKYLMESIQNAEPCL